MARRPGTEAARGEEAGRVMGQMAREVASRVLEDDTSCLVWETSQGVRVAVCWQVAGGPIEAVAFGVEEGEAEGRVY